VCPFAETILLLTVAPRTDKRLLWDSEKTPLAGAPEANALSPRKYHER
jgi:hypothetical protein